MTEQCFINAVAFSECGINYKQGVVVGHFLGANKKTAVKPVIVSKEND